MIDFNTCKPLDVIKESALLHPSLLSEGIYKMAATHFGYASQTQDRYAGQCALRAGRDAMEAKLLIEREEFEPIAARTGPLVQAFTVAANLMCLPPSLRQSIIARA